MELFFYDFSCPKENNKVVEIVYFLYHLTPQPSPLAPSHTYANSPRLWSLLDIAQSSRSPVGGTKSPG